MKCANMNARPSRENHPFGNLITSGEKGVPSISSQLGRPSVQGIHLIVGTTVAGSIATSSGQLNTWRSGIRLHPGQSESGASAGSASGTSASGAARSVARASRASIEASGPLLSSLPQCEHAATAAIVAATETRQTTRDKTISRRIGRGDNFSDTEGLPRRLELHNSSEAKWVVSINLFPIGSLGQVKRDVRVERFEPLWAVPLFPSANDRIPRTVSPTTVYLSTGYDRSPDLRKRCRG